YGLHPLTDRFPRKLAEPFADGACDLLPGCLLSHRNPYRECVTHSLCVTRDAGCVKGEPHVHPTRRKDHYGHQQPCPARLSVMRYRSDGANWYLLTFFNNIPPLTELNCWILCGAHYSFRSMNLTPSAMLLWISRRRPT